MFNYLANFKVLSHFVPEIHPSAGIRIILIILDQRYPNPTERFRIILIVLDQRYPYPTERHILKVSSRLDSFEQPISPKSDTMVSVFLLYW